MNDLISRQDAIEALNKMKIYRPLDSDRYVISDCLNRIVNLPSAQPKKGHWIMTHDYFTGESIYYAKCSICGEDSLEEGNYCHNCGAKMVDPQESEE